MGLPESDSCSHEKHPGMKQIVVLNTEGGTSLALGLNNDGCDLQGGEKIAHICGAIPIDKDEITHCPHIDSKKFRAKVKATLRLAKTRFLKGQAKSPSASAASQPQ